MKAVIEITSCRVCGSETQSEFCETCGSSQNLNTCKNCNTDSFDDYCEGCGKPLTELAFRFEENKTDTTSLEILSPEEAEEILISMESLLRPDVKRMQEKMRQRVILQREREYFQEREERIQKYNGENRAKVKVASSEEILRIQERMKQFSGYLERERLKKEEEERRIQRLQKEEEARIAEEKREKKRNRYSGIWVSTTGLEQITLDLREANAGIGKAYVSSILFDSIDILKVKWSDPYLEFRTTKIHVKWIAPFFKRIKMNFSGRVSEDGESITGILSSAETWQEVFIKN